MDRQSLPTPALIALSLIGGMRSGAKDEKMSSQVATTSPDIGAVRSGSLHSFVVSRMVD